MSPTDTRSRRRRKDADRVRLAVSRCAAALFVEHGIEGTTGEAIAEAAGVSKRTVRRHFRTKEACVEPLLLAAGLRFVGQLNDWPRHLSIDDDGIPGMPTSLCLRRSEEDLMEYPPSKREQVSETRYGMTIADPYRWLEKDGRRNPEVRRWIEAQNAVTANAFAQLPGRDMFKERLTALFDHERLSVPEKRGERYFFTRNSGLDNQAVLLVREGRDGSDRVLIDPSGWSSDGATALAEWAPSNDGKRVAYAIQDGGTDWRTIRVMDVDTGQTLEDEIHWARFTQIAWIGDGSGFFYARNPAPEGDTSLESPVLGHEVYFHRLGTPQVDDRLIQGQSGDLPLLHWFSVTSDARYAVLSSTPMTGGNSLAIIDLSHPIWEAHTVVEGYDHAWSLVGNVGARLFLSNQRAERGEIVTYDLTKPESGFTELIAEREDQVLLLASIVGDKLIVSYMSDAKTRVERFTLDGRADGAVDLPGIGTAGAFRSREGEEEAFFIFSSFDSPTSIYCYDVSSGATSLWAAPVVATDLTAIDVQQLFFSSNDGTRVPMFVVRRRDVAGSAPTMLTGYGGFGIPMVPFFSPEAIAWVEQGGVFASANIRGGGEYGEAWHRAGRREHKQNVFNDFIAAAEFLKSEGIASKDGLAIQGGSNGGLLIGAVVNQRPHLFAAALPDVGVMDMLRFDQFTGGQLWIQEFGDPAKEADFLNLRSYSPLHNICSEGDYPAILTTTADADDRVVPGHSFKYIAALQHADLGLKPRLLRVETRAGHGAGKPVEKVIEKTADMWAFAAHWTGMEITQPVIAENYD